MLGHAAAPLILFPFDLLAQQILVAHDESLVGGETRSSGRAPSRSRKDFSGEWGGDLKDIRE